MNAHLKHIHIIAAIEVGSLRNKRVAECGISQWTNEKLHTKSVQVDDACKRIPMNADVASRLWYGKASQTVCITTLTRQL
jgi:hypothetical protein